MEVTNGEALEEVGSFYTRDSTRASSRGAVGGAEFTRSGQTEDSNATISRSRRLETRKRIEATKLRKILSPAKT